MVSLVVYFIAAGNFLQFIFICLIVFFPFLVVFFTFAPVVQLPNFAVVGGRVCVCVCVWGRGKIFL